MDARTELIANASLAVDGPVIVVVGPTAVGKSAVADEIARRLSGEVVSADSMQVYRGMDVGTAKTAEGLRRVRHHCIDIADPGDDFSAALFQRCARDAFAEIASRGLIPVLAGGTGLYIRAAVDDMRFPPGDQGDNVVRREWESFAADRGSDALHAVLAEKDPGSAALIHPNNVRRVVRALEMLSEGTSYAEQHQGFSARKSIYDARFVGLTMERSVLYRRIDDRVDEMIAGGLIEEVRRLLDQGLRRALTAAQAIGYKEMVPVVEGTASLDQAIGEIKQASRRYAKRQLTWFRADPRIRWVDVTELSPEQATDAALAALDWLGYVNRPTGE